VTFLNGPNRDFPKRRRHAVQPIPRQSWILLDPLFAPISGHR
jgi:hypothetical protein